jgi:hypothetical protein
MSLPPQPGWTSLQMAETLSPELFGDIDPRYSNCTKLKTVDFIAKQGRPGLKHSLERFEIEVEFAKGSEDEAVRRMQLLLSAYIDSEDLIGAGLCKIMEGDSILSQPYCFEFDRSSQREGLGEWSVRPCRAWI